MKKIMITIALFTLALLLNACEQDRIEVAFVLDGEVLETRKLDEPSMLYNMPNPTEAGRFFLGWFHDEDLEHFYDYQTIVEVDMTLYGKTIEVTEGEDNTYLSERLEIPEYENKSFLDDGIGAVELFACRDGDTADFIEGDEVFRVRFLAIDTPESGHVFEPWGVAASSYACERMRNAETIVLEFDEAAGNRRGNYGRYLAFVWVDGINLNLELIELGYTPAQGAGAFKYAYELQTGHLKADFLNLRLHEAGESDPDFPYGVAAEDISIEDLITGDYESRFQHRFNVEGVVTANLGSHVFIEDLETGHGIFFFMHYAAPNPRLAIGNRVLIQDAQFYRDGKPFQSFFLTDQGRASIDVLDQGVDFDRNHIPFDAITQENSGLVARYENLTITGFEEHEMTFYVEDEHGNEMPVHQLGATYIDDDLFSSVHWVDFDTLEIGMTISFDVAISETRTHGMTLILLGHERFEINE